MASVDIDTRVPDELAREFPDTASWFVDQLEMIKAALAAGDAGVSGTFISADGTPKTITVVDGIVTAIV